MVSTPSPPPPPDPVATAKAQEATNVRSATNQQELNMVNQLTPQGNLTYEQIGKWDDGTPKFSATTALSPQEQKIYDTGAQTRGVVGDIGLAQSKKIGDLLGSPVNLNNDATEARLMELGSRRLNPVFERQREQQRTELINRGIMPGSEAYATETGLQGQKENDAITQLLLQGHGQAVQEALTQRNQPINEITALMSGSQVSQPNFVGTPQTQVAPTDYLGAVNTAYMGELNNYNQKVGQQNAMIGGLAGLGGAALGGWGMGGFKMPKFG